MPKKLNSCVWSKGGKNWKWMSIPNSLIFMWKNKRYSKLLYILQLPTHPLIDCIMIGPCIELAKGEWAESWISIFNDQKFQNLILRGKNTCARAKRGQKLKKKLHIFLSLIAQFFRKIYIFFRSWEEFWHPELPLRTALHHIVYLYTAKDKMF